MIHLWGRDYTRRDLESYMGDLRQVADIRLATLDDGQERGVRVAEVRTGSGFDFTVLLDRAMDIGTATFNGVPIAWQSGTGASHPSRFEPSPRGWLRGFHGGLLALCGLTQAGAADQDGEEVLGLHGRINNTPAYDISIERDWEKPILRLRGTVDELVLFGHRLRLERVMEFVPGTSAVTIQDRVRNFGGLPAPLMILYHCNFGWPLVSPESTMKTDATSRVPRDAAAEPGIDIWHKMQSPTPGYAEQVFFHKVDTTAKQFSASIVNPTLGLGAGITFDPKTLTYLTQWKQMGYGDYTIGLEPANCLPEGRVKAREGGRLRMLQPDESETFTLTLEAFKV